MTERMQARAYGVVTTGGELVRADLLDRYAIKQESRQMEDPFQGAGGLAGQVLQPRYDPEKLAGVLDLNTYHTRACKTKARDTAGLGWVLTPKGPRPAKDSAEERESLERKARLERFFLELDPPEGSATHETTLQDILYEAQLDYESVGYGALELIRENDDPKGAPVKLHHVPAKTIRLHKNRRMFVQSRGSKKRYFKRVELDGDVEFQHGEIRPRGTMDPARRATEILWWRNYSPNDETYGAPDHIPALGAIHGDLSRRNFNISFFDNYAMPAYAVFITGSFDPGPEDDNGKTELDKIIEEHFQNIRKNPHSTLVLTLPVKGKPEDAAKVEVHFEKLSVDVKEASFRLYRTDNREEVLSSHGVPPSRVGVNEAGVPGREATEIYKRSVIEPRQRVIEGLINRYVVRAGFGIDDWEFELFEIDNRDESHELDLLVKLHTMGAVTSREVRQVFADRFGIDPELPDTQDAGVQAVGIPALLQGRVITRNEARAMLGLDRMEGGDEFLEPEQTVEVEAALRSLRDDLVTIARKSDSNGHRSWLEKVLS